MISFDEGLALIRAAARPLEPERVALAAAAGRILAGPVVARLDSPRADVSAMDGYAVRDADLAALPVLLQLVGGSFAGKSWDGSLEPGQCVRIFTGAPVPGGADRVVMQEDVRASGNGALIAEHPGPARHIRKRGSDFVAGAELLASGRLLDPRAMVAAAAADVAVLSVRRRPRLRILSTGDELAEPGTAGDRVDAVPESVSLAIAALAAQWGAQCEGRTRHCDDLPAMRRAAEAAGLEADVVVVTGGASVGDRDFARPMFEPLGLQLLFSKLSIKPGKPVWLGRVGHALVLGLPGNPTSALVTGRLLLAPLLAAMAGRPIEQALAWRTLPLTTPLGPCGPRETFHRARRAGDGAEILSFQDSSAQKALADADLLVRQRAHTPALVAGDSVEVLDF